MPGFCLQARPPTGDPGPVSVVRDADVVASFLEDAAHFPGGHATELVRPSSEAQIAEVLRRSASILAIGAQSSLTGGATPMGELLLSTARLDRIESVGADFVRVQAGVDCAAALYKKAGITNPIEQIDCAEIYVPFSWYEPMWLEGHLITPEGDFDEGIGILLSMF